NARTTLGAAQSWLVGPASSLTIGGPVHNLTFTLTVGGAGNTAISSVIDGSGGLTKTGNGTLTLIGGNLYSGTTTVVAGKLLLDYANPSAASAILPNTALVVGGSAANGAGSGTLEITGPGHQTGASAALRGRHLQRCECLPRRQHRRRRQHHRQLHPDRQRLLAGRPVQPCRWRHRHPRRWNHPRHERHPGHAEFRQCHDHGRHAAHPAYQH